MKLSLQMTTAFALVFALGCLGVAVSGFLSLGELTDATQRADSKGFAWFWTFLGGIGLAVAAISVWMVRRDDRAGGGKAG